MPEQPVTVVIAYRARPGAVDVALRELNELVATVVATEPHCRGIRLYQDPADPTRILLHERWADRGSYLGPHMRTPHLTGFIDRAKDFLAGPPEIGFLHHPADEVVTPIGRVHSTLQRRADAPMQGFEGAPDARVQIYSPFVSALDGLEAGQDVILLTWLHEAQRDVLAVHPRDDFTRPLAGVFATRSPDRPNPIGLHRVELLAIDAGGSLHVRGLEAIDGTPILDIKPVLARSRDA